MFVLLFAFVFGGAIPLPGGGSYREFLMPGIFAQTVVFAAATTAIGMTDDVNKGIIDRFRSLPMARSAVLSGRTLSDLVYNAGILVVLMLSGLAVGWRVHTGLLEFLAGVGLLLLFTFAMSWVGRLARAHGAHRRGRPTRSASPSSSRSPSSRTSSSRPRRCPAWLQPIAEWNPVSALTAATRELWGNPNPYATAGFPAEHPILLTLIWVVVLVAVFAPLGVRRYRSMSRSAAERRGPAAQRSSDLLYRGRARIGPVAALCVAGASVGCRRQGAARPWAPRRAGAAGQPAARRPRMGRCSSLRGAAPPVPPPALVAGRYPPGSGLPGVDRSSLARAPGGGLQRTYPRTTVTLAVRPRSRPDCPRSPWSFER